MLVDELRSYVQDSKYEYNVFYSMLKDECIYASKKGHTHLSYEIPISTLEIELGVVDKMKRIDSAIERFEQEGLKANVRKTQTKNGFDVHIVLSWEERYYSPSYVVRFE